MRRKRLSDHLPARSWLSLIGDLLGTGAAISLGTAAASIYASYMTPSVGTLRVGMHDLARAFLQEEALLPILVVVLLSLSGAYRRSRFYKQHRGLTVINAVTLAYLLYVGFLYLLVRRPPEARTDLVASFLFTIALLLFLRHAKASMIRAESEVAAGPLTGSDGRHILVIGGAGYIGSQLCENLLHSGYRVRVLDNLTYGDRAIRHLLNHPQMQLITADMRHLERLAQAVVGVDAVVHLGAIVGDPACALDNETTIEINLLATRMVRDLCHATGKRRLIFASTCSVYGAGDGISQEDSELHPVSLYACTKIDSERCLLEAEGPCCAVIFRLATVFGLSPRPRFDLVVNLLSAQAHFRKQFSIFNPGQWRPLVHVADVCRALQLGLEADSESVRNQIFNLGDDGMNFTLGQIGELVCSHFPEAAMQFVERTADHRDYRVDFSRIRKTLGFRCERSLDSGIAELKQAFVSGRIADYQDPFYYNLDSLRNEPPKSLNLSQHHGTSREFIARAAATGR